MAYYGRPWTVEIPLRTTIGYLLGAWISDGNVNPSTGQVRFHNTELDFLKFARDCALDNAIPGVSDIKLVTSRSNSKGHKDLYCLHIYSVAFSSWIVEQSGQSKDKVPSILYDSSRAVQIAFLSGAIDGDGHVTTEGCIRIRTSYQWLLDIPSLCESISIRCTAPKLERLLPSGRQYRRVSVHRSDFLNAGGHLVIHSKQDRLEHPIYREKRKYARKTTPCPNCGQPKSPEASLCRTCYLASEGFHEHLQSIAKVGNKAAIIARWGKKPD